MTKKTSILLAILRTELEKLEQFRPITFARSYNRCVRVTTIDDPSIEQSVEFARNVLDNSIGTDVAFYAPGFVTVIALRRGVHGPARETTPWQLESRASGQWIVYGSDGIQEKEPQL